MNEIIVQIFPAVLIVLIVFIPSYSVLKYYDIKNKKRKSPLNIKLLRSPGQSLQESINELTADLMENIAITPLIPAICYCQLISMFAFNEHKPSAFIIIIFTFLVLCSIVYFSIKSLKILKKRNMLRLAYECEVAVGQDLQNELTNGFKIYHDFPAENFNIDHVAIGPSGVFAIETKGRSKSSKAENKNWKVTFDGQNLIFPEWQEKQPINQSKRQARWLENWLKKATAENIHVTPVLALPGWYIERKATTEVLIYNGKKSNFLANRPNMLSEKQVQTIAFQIENKCRTIEGKSYKKIAYNNPGDGPGLLRSLFGSRWFTAV